MKAVIVLFAVVAVAASSVAPVIPATTLVRTPSFDSAIIKSDRLGGNFAYSTVEGHAYAAVSPVVQRITEPVAVSYTAHQVPLGYAAAPVAVTQKVTARQSIYQPVYTQQHLLSSPFLGQLPIFGQSPIFAQSPFGIAQAPVVAAPAPAAPTPVEGTVVDADTVAVDSA